MRFTWISFLLVGAVAAGPRAQDAHQHGGAGRLGTVDFTNSCSADVQATFARGMAPLMQLPARLLVDLIGGDTGQPLRVLDVAAGHGLFGITIAERYPQARVTALDWPQVLAVAEENARLRERLGGSLG